MSRPGAIAVGIKRMAWLSYAGTLTLFGGFSCVAAAQTAGAGDKGPVEEIVVTGTSIRGASPVGSATTSMDREDIKATGLTTAVDIIRTLPQIQNIGADETRTVGRDGAADNTGRGSAINLRGLGNNATLLLLDGRRVAANGTASAFGDPNQIPAAALAQIEVVTDGASAVYGSDAIAGVVNLILRKNYDGAETSFVDSGNGDYNSQQLSQTFGKKWNGGSVALSYQYFTRNAMLQSASPYLQRDQRALGGIDGRISGTTTTPGPLAGNIVAGSGATAQLYGIPAGLSGTPTLAQIVANKGNLNLADSSFYSDFLPKQERHNATLYAEQEVNKNVTLFGEAFYNHRLSEARNYSPGSSTPSVVLKPNTPFFVAGVPGASATTGYTVQLPTFPYFGETVNSYPESSYAATAGVKAKLPNKWAAELFGTLSGTRLCNCTPAINSTVLQALVDTGKFNPYAPTAQSLSAIGQFMSDARQETHTKLRDFQVKADGPIYDIAGGPIKAAVGYSNTYAFQSLIRVGSDRTTDPVVPIGTPLPGVAFTSVPTETSFASRNTAKDRTDNAVFAELFVPIIGKANQLPFVKKLDLDLALRHDQYSDVGSTTNPKVGFTLKPADRLTLRGTWGTSFRAPSLPESNPYVQGGVRAFAFVNGAKDPTIPITNASNGTTNGIVLDGGNAALKPETATTYSFGADWSPAVLPGLNLGATYYNVAYKDRIESLTSLYPNWLTNATNRALYAPFIVAAPQPKTCVEGNPATYNPAYLPYLANPSFVISTTPQCSYAFIFNAANANLGDMNQDGIDFQGSYSFSTSLGEWMVGLSGTKILNLKRQLSPISGQVDVLDTISFPVSMHARANLSWAREKWSAHVFANYTGRYLNNAPITVNGVQLPVATVPSVTTFDMSVGFDGGDKAEAWWKRLSLALGIQNMFNKNPPVVLSSATAPYAYDSQNANVLGRIYTATVTHKW